ncbi:extracellular solute-binding protein [Cohnella sp. AR92]|uniref:extracellular solute-binding protein n=1 Tax=Cohnella sp. AR92 TaxID=648716 RepID=UPI0013155D14|nr:extracellular solute-binding protein [Cohnella sp. AR92]
MSTLSTTKLALPLLLAPVLLSSCAGHASPSDATALVKETAPAFSSYDAPVTLRIGFKIPDARLTTGDTNDNNPMSRYFEELTNIKVVHSWEAKGDEAFGQKVSLAIASSDIPDAMVVDRSQLRKLIEYGMIQDLTDAYEDYGSSLVKGMYDATEGAALEEARFGGKLYGLPNIAIEADATSLLWVRQDWLDRLNLKPPRTLDDIAAIAKSFIERDPDGNGKRDTVGLAGYKSLVYGQKLNVSGFDAVFSSFHAFPKNWVRDASGNVVYGSIMPENKLALEKLAEWYKLGLIDPQFALYKEAQEPITSNRTGIFFGPWWMPYWPLSEAVASDTKAEWRAYAAPLDADGQYVTHMAPVTDRYLVVRKGYEHPEAAIKLLNAFTRLERRQDPNEAAVKQIDEFAAKTGVQPRQYYPFDLLLDYTDAIEQRYLGVKDALDGKRTVASLDPDTRKIYDYWLAEQASPKKDMDGWKAAKAYEYGGSALLSRPMEKVKSVFYGTTRTMEKRWADLERLENETFLNIVVGDQPIDAFDGFAQEWKRQGGDQITREVQAVVGSH